MIYFLFLKIIDFKKNPLNSTGGVLLLALWIVICPCWLFVF